MIEFARATPLATGQKFGRRTVRVLIGLAAITAVLATGWALPPIRDVLTAFWPLARAKLPEGMAGMTRLHAIIGEHVSVSAARAVMVLTLLMTAMRWCGWGLRLSGPWVQALIAAGYQVYAINPLQVARYRERGGVSGAKSDPAGPHVLADMVRTDHPRLRPVAGTANWPRRSRCSPEPTKL